ncbi:uncharacterized protein LOC114350863 [Ostrinia furnacalis]|uniref:uncharacterized protein LOC114350863 n=1 Tax=Ostrinia furnacalis TaxID=93504 RepID=UPI00103E8E88|nr:uncharacterized protein LOC114350863 [Ostrinia furnacalis]
MSETPQDCDLPPAKKLKRDESCDLPKSGTDSKFANDKYEDFVSPEELEKLKEFQVLDEVRSNDEDSNDDDSEMSDGKSDGLPEDEIEKMLEEDLPEGFKGAPKPKERPYITRQKIVLEEKGVNYYEVLPLDWMMVRHYSGMPVYVHRTTRVCTLSKPYFLGKGNTRRHDIPISAIPCLSYRKALEEEKKQKEIDKRIAEQIRSGNWVVNSADNNGDKESVANASNEKTGRIEMSETPQDCDLPPAKKLKRDESCDLPKSGTDSKFANDKYEDFVSPEELEKLKEFQVLDEVRSNDEDSNDDDSEMSDGKSDGLPEDEIEKMLEEDLPEGFKGAPKPKERPYITRQKIVLEEKGVNYYEVLPLDWMMVRHYSGMPVYVHRSTRVCTLSKPYFLGKGNTRRHDIPISAIPCLSYRKALEEEKKQKEIDKRIAEQIRSGNWVVNSADNNGDKESVANASNEKNNEINNVDDRNENVVTKCPFKFSNTINADNVVLNNDGYKNDNVEQSLASETTNEDKLTKINLLKNEARKPSLSKIENTFALHNEDTKKNLLAKMIVDSEAIKMGTEATKMGTEATKMGSETTKMGTEAAQKTLAEENEKECNSNKTKQAEPVTKKEVSNETNEDESEHSQDEQVLNTEGVNEGCEVPEAAGQRPVVLPGGVVMPPPRVETVATSWKTQHLTPEQVNEYCKRLFKFNTVNIMHFMRWADRRKYTKARKTLQYPTLPEGTKLITIPAAPANGQDNGAKTNKRDWVLNMNGRSYLSVFHEYVRRALQKQPVYEFVQLENAATPYQATVYIGGMQYGVGHGSSKRQAKSAAARASIHILIPEMKDELDAGTSAQEPDFSFFDYVGIEDPRITEFCAATCEPSPHAILRTCLLRNFGATDRHISTEMKKLEFQKIELTMKVGKHSATVVCKNKKTAKQRASQAILQVRFLLFIVIKPENAATPYQATVYIGGMQYGVGHGSSKRQAKSAAARASIHILIPEMKDELDAGTSAQEPDFSFFDYVGIEDPRITEFCAATCEPSPHAILRTCLLRNFGATDRHISTEMKKLEFQKIELTMKVGKHSATVVCKNKKTAKQRASQAILQALHPHVRSWGSLLRLYGSRSVKSCKEKKLEEQQITLLQDKARHNEPNYAVLEKLRHEMCKLRERDAACAPIGTLLLAAALPTHSGANLNNVEL